MTGIRKQYLIQQQAVHLYCFGILAPSAPGCLPKHYNFPDIECEACLDLAEVERREVSWACCKCREVTGLDGYRCPVCHHARCSTPIRSKKRILHAE